MTRFFIPSFAEDSTNHYEPIAKQFMNHAIEEMWHLVETAIKQALQENYTGYLYYTLYHDGDSIKMEVWRNGIEINKVEQRDFISRIDMQEVAEKVKDNPELFRW